MTRRHTPPLTADLRSAEGRAEVKRAADLRSDHVHVKNGALMSGSVLTTFGMGLLAPILPAFASSLGASATLIGLLLAGFGLTRLLTALPAVWIAQRLGYRRLLVGSPVIIAPAAALCAVTPAFWLLAMFCLIEGGAAAIYSMAGTSAVASDAEPQRRGRSMASYQVAGLVGASFGPMVGGLVGQQFGLRAPFLLYAALAASAAFLLHRWLKPDPSPPRALDGDGTMSSRSLWRLVVGSGLPPLWLLAFALVFVRSGALLIVAPLLGAQRLGLSAGAIGVAFTLGSLATLSMYYPAGWLSDRCGRKVAIVPGGLGMVGALTLFMVGGSFAAFAAAALLLGAASGLVGPGPAAYLADVVPAQDRTTGVGAYRMLGDAGMALAPPLLGWLADRGGFDAALLASSLLLVTAVGAFAWRAAGGWIGRPIPAPSAAGGTNA